MKYKKDSYTNHDYLLTQFPDYSPTADPNNKSDYKYMAYETGPFILVRQWSKDIGRWTVGIMSKQSYQKQKGWVIKEG